MFAKDLMSPGKMSISVTDSVVDALRVMEESGYQHLALTDNGKLVNIVGKEDLLRVEYNPAVGSLSLDAKKIGVEGSDHLLDVFQKMVSKKLTIMPVVDSDENLFGCIGRNDLYENLGKMFSFSEPGGLIVIRMPKINYSLAEISRIIEAERTAILSSVLSSDSENENESILLTLKLHSFDIQDVVAALKRHGFEIIAYFTEQEFREVLSDRYDQLISYLNV